jgi:hypothetical protein
MTRVQDGARHRDDLVVVEQRALARGAADQEAVYPPAHQVPGVLLQSRKIGRSLVRQGREQRYEYRDDPVLRIGLAGCLFHAANLIS